MATKTSTLTENLDVETVLSVDEINKLPEKNGGRTASVPAPGRSMSFEEAKAWTIKRYGNALRGLAK